MENREGHTFDSEKGVNGNGKGLQFSLNPFRLVGVDGFEPPTLPTISRDALNQPVSLLASGSSNF
jgi:hypothetical protein